MGCLDRLESLKHRFSRLRPAWTRSSPPPRTRGLQIGYPENFRKLTDDAFTSSVFTGTEQNSIKEKHEVHDTTSSHPSSKLERTSTKDSQDDGKSESMIETRDRGDTLPEHSSTAELVGMKDSQDVTADQAPEGRTGDGL